MNNGFSMCGYKLCVFQNKSPEPPEEEAWFIALTFTTEGCIS